LTLFFLGVFAASLILSFVLTRSVRDVATRHGLVSLPGSERHLHRQPLPRIGGAAIFLAFSLTVGIAFVTQWFIPKLSFWPSLNSVAAFLVPAGLIFGLGIYDDIRSVGPYVKFSIQIIAAILLFAGGLRISDLPLIFGARHLPWIVGLAFTVIWVVAITNAFNLIDGLDGLAAGSALFSTLVVLVVALLSHSSLVALMTIALAGAIVGFLRFNFNPATIFLGDCGSLFIGFMLSALAIQGAQKAPTIIAVAIPVVSFGLPILETTLSILRRFLSGRPVFTADREHIHHKLLQMGLSHRQVVVVLYAVSAIFALLSLFLLWPAGGTLGLVLAILGTGIWVGIQHLGYLEFGELQRAALRTMDQRQIFINNLAVRRAVEELKVTQAYDQLGRILVSAFSNNDFDAIDLRLPSDWALPDTMDLVVLGTENRRTCLRWVKPASHFEHEMATAWSMNLDLVSSKNEYCGSLTIYRLYSDRKLQMDINVLTSVFPIALADALYRTMKDRIEQPITLPQPSVMAAMQAS
jgi:UDP-GlcNAc:undecaprenyl-phosphate GlcNAc-1-phosphate transferase